MKNDPRELGYLTYDVLRERIKLPSRKRLAKGPVAIIECIEDIPCDPCVEACRIGAIRKESLITPPYIDYDKCTGCAVCVDICPGLAIFVVNMNHSERKAVVSLPYEMLPVPKVREKVDVLDRSGKKIGVGEIVKVRKGQAATFVVSISLDKDLAMEARSIRVSASVYHPDAGRDLRCREE